MGNGSTNPDISSIKPRKPTKLGKDPVFARFSAVFVPCFTLFSDTSDESSQIQITTISTTVQAPLWITAPVNRLRVISGLSKSITKRLRSSSRQDQYPPPKRARPDPSPTMPTVDSTQPSPVSAKTPPPGRPSSRGPTDFRTPTKKPRPKVHTDSPNKHQFPDSTVPGTGNYCKCPSNLSLPKSLSVAQQLPDSSSVNNVIGDYKEYYNNGLQLKDRAREQEDTRCYLSAFVTFTEALHNFNMAVYLLVNDLDRIVSSGGKNNVEQSREIRKNAMKIADLIGNHNIKLCHKITNSEYGRKQKSLSESEQRIFEQLMIMCLRCESKLHLIVYKAQTAHQDHSTSIQSNGELIRRIESAGTPEFRESEEVRLNKDQWKTTKCVINHFRNFQKAEMAWAAAERISRKNCKIHDDFFDNIRYLADVPKLTFYESSLKDLASYQRAMAGKLRDEIQSNPTLS